MKRKFLFWRRIFLFCLSLLAVLLNLTASHGIGADISFVASPELPGSTESASGPSSMVYFPVVFGYQEPVHAIFIPRFDGQVKGSETAVFWFGKVTQSDNSADVRLGYNNDSIWVRVSIIDRRLWHDSTPTPADLLNWDAVSLFLDIDNTGNSLGSGRIYRFDAQLSWWEERPNFQAVYQGTSSGWKSTSLEFSTRTQWWGFPEPDDDKDDRAWKVEYTIPFKNLGLSGPPAQGSYWRLAVQVHDRDSSSGSPAIPDQTWPTGMHSDQPGSWGFISLGLPSYKAPAATNPMKISLRNGVNGITVLDGAVGGNTDCGKGLNLWTEWGKHAYVGSRDITVQNQGNTDDWPCFSKIYITFPLTSLPHNKVIISATLTLHQSGQASGFSTDPPEANNSLIQVFQAGQGWDEATLAWNNGPLPLENVGQAWVGNISMAELGAARTWDVSRAVANAYKSGESLSLVLYSADYYGPHGKYFFSSESTDYGGDFRPRLEITLGDP